MNRVIKSVFIAAMIAVLAPFYACKHEPADTPAEGSLSINWKAVYGGAPLVLFQDYPYPIDSQLFRVTTALHFFVSDIRLLQGTNEVKVKDIDFIDFKTVCQTVEASQNGLTKFVTNKVPPGNYTGIRFGIGVAPVYNAKSPEDFPSSSVLSNGDEYWRAWNSYIFMKIEGRNTNAAGSVSGFTFHSGLDVLYRTCTINKPIKITANEASVVTITFDVLKAFTDGVTTVDIRATPDMQNPNTYPNEMGQICNNLVNAFQ
jgi:hypothetical protein